MVEVFHLLRAPLGACSRTIATNCFPSTESLIGEEAIVAPVWKNQSGLPDPESTATKVASGRGGKHDATAGAQHARGKRAANDRVLPHHLAGRRISGQHKIPIRSTRCIAGREGYATYVLPPLLKDRGRAAISLAVVACHHVQPGTVGIKRGLCQLDPPNPVDPCNTTLP